MYYIITVWVAAISLLQPNLITCHNADRIIDIILQSLPATCTYFCLGCHSGIIIQMEHRPHFITSQVPAANESMQKIFKENFFCVTIVISLGRLDPSVNMSALEGVLKKTHVPLVMLLGDSIKEETMLNSVPRVAIQKSSKTDKAFSISVAYANQSETLNYWTEKHGFTRPSDVHKHLSQSINIARTSMSGKNLTVSVFGTEPWVVYKGKTITGVEARLVGILAQGLNFTYSFRLETSWLTENLTTNTVSGTIGSIYNGISQLGIGNVVLSPARFRFADYTTVIFSFTGELVSRKPAPKNTFRNLLTPFRALPWGLTCFSTLFFAIVFALSKGNTGGKEYSIWNLAIASFVILTRQPIREHLFHKITMKVLYVTWLIGAGFLTAFYLSNLLASLMVIEYERPIDNLRDVIDLGRTFYIPGGTVMRDYISSTPRQDYQEAYQLAYLQRKGDFSMVRGWVPESVEKGIVEEGGVLLGFNFMLLSRFDDNLKRYGRNPFRSGKESIVSTDCAFPIQKHSPWRPKLDRVLGQLRDMGFVIKFKRDATNYKALLDARMQRGGEGDIRPITIVQMALIFLFMFGGIAIGLAAFVFEFCVGKKEYIVE